MRRTFKGGYFFFLTSSQSIFPVADHTPVVALPSGSQMHRPPFRTKAFALTASLPLEAAHPCIFAWLTPYLSLCVTSSERPLLTT